MSVCCEGVCIIRMYVKMLIKYMYLMCVCNICMCACVHVCVYVCLHVCMYVCTVLRYCICMHICILHTHTHTHTFVQKVDAGKATKPPAKKGRLEAEDARLESLAALKVRSQHMA